MAMRLYSKDEFEEDLRVKWNLAPTDHKTNTARLWKTSDGKYVVVPELPNGERYPDYLLHEVIEQLKAVKS